MEPLIVRAWLESGLVMGGWGIGLDGILAAELWHDLKADARLDGTILEPAGPRDEPLDLPLPLARCELAGGDTWHWAATTAQPDHVEAGVEARYWTARVDHRHLEQVAATMPKVISGRQGRYRAKHMPAVAVRCRSVSWRAFGDLTEIATIVESVATIGKRRASGEGRVTRWEVSADPDGDVLSSGHLHCDGSLGRPVPDECLASVGVVEAGHGIAGLRPPVLHPRRQRNLALPALVS